jgi:GNAT superfamily N-acetyltransferase
LPQKFHAGAASAAINPPIGSFIAGDARNRRFTGVHDDLHAKAVVIGDGSTAVALVSIDCIGLTFPTVEAIRRRVMEQSPESGLAPGRILICSTHTHSGPDVVGLWGPDMVTSGRDPEYMEFLEKSCADAIVSAAEHLAPVRGRWAAVEHGSEWVRNICEPDVLDLLATILHLEDDEGRTVATMTNFACHPTILDGVHDVVSTDWVGGLYRGLADSLPGEHLYFQGAIGSWVQPVKGDRSFALADRYGRGLATALLDALEDAQPLKDAALIEDAGVEAAHRPVSFPLENEGFRQLSQLGMFDRDFSTTVDSEVAWCRIGDMQFATHPGETPPAYSKQTRAMMGGGPSMVLGLGLDALGYIMEPDWFGNDDIPHTGYLASMSVGPETGPALLEALRAVIPGASRT